MTNPPQPSQILPSTQHRPGIALFAHGSRDPLWRAPMEAVRLRIKAQHPQLPVCCCYLELCAPTLQDAVQELVSRGVDHVTVVPMFLGTGKHAREDLPGLMQSLRSTHPTVQFQVQQAIGEDPRMTALMADIACSTG